MLKHTDPASTPTAGFRLSPPQQRVWSGPPGTWTQCRVRVTGSASPDKIARAVRAVVTRHESLRSRLVEVPGLAVPLQAVDECAEPEWFEAVLPADASAAADEIDRWAAEDRRRPPDHGLRGRFLAGHDSGMLVLTASSVFVDRGSFAVIFADLAACLGGGEPGEVSLQYLDVAEWLHEQVIADEAQTRMQAWNRRELPAARALRVPFEPGPQDARGTGAIALGEATAAAATRAAARLGCSSAAVLLGAWHVLLWRLTGNDEVTTAFVPAARGLDDLADVIGRFESPVPVLTVMSPSLPFRTLADDLAGALSEAPAEQFCFTGTDSGTVLPFTFAHTRLPAQLRAGELSLRMEDVSAGPRSSIIHLDVTEDVANGPATVLSYDKQIVSQRHAVLIAAQLSAVVEAVAQTDRLLDDLGVTGPDEAARVLAKGIGEHRSIPGPALVHQCFELHARTHPDALAVTCAGLRLSYGQVDVRANQVAHALRDHGVGPGALVALVVERSVDYVIGLLGVLKAGGAFVPIDPALPAARRVQMIEDAAAAVVVTHHGLTGRGQAAVIDLDDFAERAGMPTTPPEVAVEPDDLAYVIFTSGSTGHPKGVAVPHRAVRAYVEGVLPELDLPDRAVLGTLATPAADLGHTALFGALCTGRSFWLASGDEVLSADRLARRLREHPVDLLKIVPSHLAALLDAPEAADLLPRSCLVFGGEELTTPLVEQVLRLRADLRIVNHYGPTETTVGALVHRVAGDEPGPVPVGAPLANYRAYVLDERLRPVLEGVRGELWIGGPAVARGYWERPAASAERFLPDPFAADPGARMYRTDDLVRQRPDGAFVFLGRADHQVKIRGNRVEPGEVEALLREDDRVADAVVTVHDAGRDRYLAAYVVARRGIRLQPEELAEHLRVRLPDYMVPSVILMLHALPLAANGKVDRAALPAPDLPAARAERYIAPRTRTEGLLTTLWEAIFDCDKVGVEDDFFRGLGGNSLDATRMVARLRTATGVALQVNTIFRAPTVSRLAELVDAARQEPAGDRIVPVERTGPVPLSAAQRRLWVLSEVDEVNAAYNVPAAVRITGPLDVDVLVRAVREVVRRHESLRTNFVLVDDIPVQVVRDSWSVPVPVIDVDAAEVPVRAREYAARPFDLASDHLLRAVLLRVTDQEHVLLVCLHHIVSDGWSTAVLWQEIVTLYTAFRAGEESPLAPLPIQYADFAVWQNQWLQGDEVSSQLAYWSERLRDLPTLLELPTDRPRPAVQGYEGASLPITLDHETVAALRALSGERHATMFMTLLAAFTALLSRYTGQQDIAVGTPIANRTRAEVEQLIGCFFNTVVIRTDLSDDPTFTELLDQTREAVLAAQSHQDLPFERLVEALNPPRDPGHTPLFQALFVYQPAPGEGLDMAGLDLESLPLIGDVAKYDLTVDLVETGAGISGRIEYRTDLFDVATIQRLAGHFAELLRGFARDPDAMAGEIPIMTDPERSFLLTEYNSDYDDTLAGSQLLPDAFEQQAAAQPDATAIVFGDRALTYRELEHAANRLAHELGARGVASGVLVGLWMERSVELVVTMLAVLKAGGAYVPLDPHAPAARTKYLIEDARLGLLLTPSTDVDALSGTVEIVDPQTGTGTGDTPPARGSSPDDPAYVIYTSGSTGMPKGVVVSLRNLAGFCAAMDRRFGDSPPGVWLALTNYTFDISVLELLWTLSRGYQVVLAGTNPVPSAPREPVRTRPVQFSLFYFASDAGDRAAGKYDLLLRGAKWADEHGFAAVWTPERHFGTFGGLYPNPVVTAAAVAALTSRIGIRAGSVVLPLHDPIRVAEDWAVIDNLSGGRVGLSVASGWQPHDFTLAPGKYTERKEIMFRDLEVVRGLWRGDAVRRLSGTGSETEVRTLPRPVQAELPVWITAAGSPATFRRAGTIGANLLTHLLGQSVDELAGSIEAYRRARREAGHAGDGHVTLMLHTFVSDDEDFVRRTVRQPFKNYLRESIDLVRPLARSRGLELEDVDEQDLDALLDHAFDRYYGTSGLFGTPERCAALVGRLGEAGVDEIACLIDFGVGTQDVLASFDHLDRLRRRTAAGQDREDHQDIAGLIERHAVTHLQCTPSLAALLVADDDARSALHRLDWLLVGGEALAPALAEALSSSVGGQVLNVYGPTEATIWSTSHLVSGASTAIGRPLANTRAYVVDERLNPVPIGVPGELCLAGDGVAAGYLHRPGLTAERFVPDRFGDPAARMYRTGDIVRHRTGGVLEFLGRRDHQVKIHGFRVELGEIEAALTDAPDVLAAVVVADDGDGADPGDKRLVAYVVAVGPFDVVALRTYLAARLPRHLVPALFVELAAMPLLPSGKVDRKALPAPSRGQRAADEFVAPGTPTERRLAEIWSELLRRPEIGLGDNFFELGGDSIIAIQMVSRAKRAGIALAARDLFGHQTLGALAAVARQGVTTHAQQGIVLGDTELAPIQRWFFEQGLPEPDHYNQAVLVDFLPGRVNRKYLAHALDAVVRQHDALRNRFAWDGDRWRQWTSTPDENTIPVGHLDLTGEPPDAWPVAIEAMRTRVHQELNLGDGPLVRTVHIDYGGRRADQILTVIHHTVVDGVSWRILMEDIQASYVAAQAGDPVDLPPKTTSYQQWVRRLQGCATADETQSELDYWHQTCRSAVAALPRDRDGANTEATTRTVTVLLTTEETTVLVRELPASQRVDVPEVLLCALAQACAPWTGSRSLLLDVEGHGREDLFDDVDVSRTVGWFTAMYPLRIELPVDPEGALRAVKQQVRGTPRRGVGFGLLRYLAPDESVRERLTGAGAEIVFNYLGQADAASAPDSILALSNDPVGRPHAPRQQRKHLLNINGIVADGRLRVEFTYSEAVHDADTIDALVTRFLAAVRNILGGGGPQLTPSDFPDIDLTQGELDDLLDELDSDRGPRS